jgi:hypothetical protein
MKTSRCAICECPITEANDSAEHIIHNFLGGRRETMGFLCRACNSTTGHAWDSALARQLADLALFFGVDRARGETPARTITTTAGEHIKIKSDGSLEADRARYEIVETPEGPRLSITAPDRASARKLLESLKRNKYPKIDVDAALEQVIEQRTYMKGAVMIRGTIGGESEGRAIVKSAAAFAHASGIPFEACEQAARYLRSASGNACFGYYWSDDLVVGRPRGVPLQCVALKGNPSTGLLLSYVEYFGFQRMVVCLSKRYEGAPVERCYAFDPTTGKALDLSVRLDFTPDEIEDIYDYKFADHEALRREASYVVEAVMKRQRDRELERVTGDAVRFALEKIGLKEGDMITAEHAPKIAGLTAHAMMPFILHTMRRPRIPPIPQSAPDEGAPDN